jgi:murein DD-endopeptidase MepM/ murein hydrolase activator NlpD
VKEGGNGGKQVYLRGVKGRLFYYAHLEDWSVEEYQAVSAGDVLGTVGDSGNAKGTTPHLHFEIMLGKEKKSVDPLKFWVNA